MINVSAVRGIFPLQYIFTSAWWKRTKPFLESESSKIVFSLQLLNWIFSCSSYICLKHVDGESILYINYGIHLGANQRVSTAFFFKFRPLYIPVNSTNRPICWNLRCFLRHKQGQRLGVFLGTTIIPCLDVRVLYIYSTYITRNYNNDLLNIGFTSFMVVC